MTFSGSTRSLVTWLFVGGTAFTLAAAACGSGDSKKDAPDGAAGAAGSAENAAGSGGADAEGGATSSGGAAGGAEAEPGGGQPGGGEGGMSSLGGASGSAGEGGSAGAPITGACEPSGNVTSLAFDNEPIFQGCRGAVVRVPFLAEAGDTALTCCGTSASTPAFEVELSGGFNDGSGTLAFEVPQDAPYGTYAMDVTCAGTSGAKAFSLEINQAGAPQVLSVSAEVEPAGLMVIKGTGLQSVSAVGAYRLSDNTYYECVFVPEDVSESEITCSFEGDIPTSVDDKDLFVIDVANETCGSARNPPPFLVVTLDK